MNGTYVLNMKIKILQNNTYYKLIDMSEGDLEIYCSVNKMCPITV